MKKYIYGFGTVAMALAMSGLPAAALAEGQTGEMQGGMTAQAQVMARVEGGNTSASVTTHVGDGQESEASSSETDMSSSTERARGGDWS